MGLGPLFDSWRGVFLPLVSRSLFSFLFFFFFPFSIRRLAGEKAMMGVLVSSSY